MKKIHFLVLFLILLFPSCYSPQNPKNATLMISDIHSFSKPQEAQTTHISLDLSVDFDKKSLLVQQNFLSVTKKILTNFF